MGFKEVLPVLIGDLGSVLRGGLMLNPRYAQANPLIDPWLDGPQQEGALSWIEALSKIVPTAVSAANRRLPQVVPTRPTDEASLLLETLDKLPLESWPESCVNHNSP